MVLGQSHQVASLVGMPTIFLHFIRVSQIDKENNLLADFSYNKNDFSGIMRLCLFFSKPI